MSSSSQRSRPKVCVVAEFYPRRRDPVLGIWAHRQALAARDAGADVRVLALERPIPPVATARALRHGDPRPLGRSLHAIAVQPRSERRDGLEVEYVRFVAPPRESAYPSWHRYAQRPLARALERLWSRWPFEAVHAHYALPAGAAALGFCRRRGLPLVVSVHGGDLYLTDPAVPPRVAAVLRTAAAVLCNSQDTLTKAAALTGSEQRMRVVHLGAAAPDPPPPRHERLTVATLGHLIARKRAADVARAVRLVSERAASPALERLRWVVIGEGPERPALERLSEQLGITDRVRLMGQLPPERALGRELAHEPHAVGYPQLLGQSLQRRALWALADHDPAQPLERGTCGALADEADRPRHVGGALARDQMAERGDRQPLVARRWRVGRRRAEVDDAHPLLGARQRGRLGERVLAVAEHGRGRAQHRRHARRHGRVGEVEIAAVHGDDERQAASPAEAQRGGARGQRVVSVHGLEGPAAPEALERPGERALGVAVPTRIGALARRSHEAHVLHLETVAALAARLDGDRVQRAAERARIAVAQRSCRGHGRDRALERQHANVRTCVAGGERLAMRPDAEHRIAPARVELGHHADLGARALTRRTHRDASTQAKRPLMRAR